MRRLQIGDYRPLLAGVYIIADAIGAQRGLLRATCPKSKLHDDACTPAGNDTQNQ